MESEIRSFINVWVASIASICYCYFIVRHIPGGITRLLFLLPIFYLFIILPFNLHSAHLCAPTSFYLVWLANFKLLLFSFDRGPLLDSKSLIHFISTALLPIKAKQDPPPKDSLKSETALDPPSNGLKKAQSSALFAIKVLLLAMVICIYDYRQDLHQSVILALYCCHLYLAVELVLALSAALSRAMPGIELEPQFKEPYLATSLQDFWGRRWNLMVTSILRPTVYDPIRSISTRLLGPRSRSWSSLPAIAATFLVSGLMHEIIFFYLTRVGPTWEVTWFFVLQGVCTAAEVAVKRVVAGRWRLPPVVSGPLTLGFVAATGAWLFFPQIIGNGVDQKAIGEYSILVNFVKNNVKVILF